jgi:hypothetical protein
MKAEGETRHPVIEKVRRMRPRPAARVAERECVKNPRSLIGVTPGVHILAEDDHTIWQTTA